MSEGSALVTGGSGFVGSHLVPALVGAGWEVRSCGRGERPSWFPAVADWRVADLADDESDLAALVEGVTHVFHLAGASSSTSAQDEMERSNVGGTTRLVAAAQRAHVERFVHMSSTSVYGEEVQLPLPVPEDVQPQPSRGYGKAKWGAEEAVWKAGVDGFPAVVLRPVTVYGPGNVKLLASAILDIAIERFAGASAVPVYREPVEQRLLHIDDLIGACMHLARYDGAVGKAFNVVLDRYPSSHELASTIATEFGMAIVLDDDPDCGPSAEERRRVHDEMRAAGMTDDILLSPERLRLMRKSNINNRLSIDALRSTGFEFNETDLPASIGRTIAWYRENRWVI
jgi:nucleoside-diphosphate-sugar epimerase